MSCWLVMFSEKKSPWSSLFCIHNFTPIIECASYMYIINHSFAFILKMNILVWNLIYAKNISFPVAWYKDNIKRIDLGFIFTEVSLDVIFAHLNCVHQPCRTNWLIHSHIDQEKYKIAFYIVIFYFWFKWTFYHYIYDISIYTHNIGNSSMGIYIFVLSAYGLTPMIWNRKGW